MDTEHALFVATAAVAFGVALLTVITQWLKADDVAEDVELDVRNNLAHLHSAAAESPTTRYGAELVSARTADDTAADGVRHVTGKLAEDETELARLFFGWGTAGMLVGLGLGGAMAGVVGALIGGVVMTAIAIGTVVVAVIVIDRIHAQAAERRTTATAAAAKATPDEAPAYARTR